MSEIAELERRLTAALDRIGGAVDEFDAGGAASEEQLDAAYDDGAARARTQADAEIAGLKEAIAAELTANAQLRERVAALKTKRDQLLERVAQMERAEAQLKADRIADRAELDDLISALTPLVKEAP